MKKECLSPAEQAALRAASIKRHEEEGSPELGIWFLFKGEFIHISYPWQDCEKIEDWYESPFTHYLFWDALQRSRPDLRYIEYDQIERGRVLYRQKPQKVFEALLSKEAIKDNRLKQLILEKFKLPEENIKFIPDLHYTVDKNLRLLDIEEEG
jgi:hypothetical protein